jgi:predicted ATPase
VDAAPIIGELMDSFSRLNVLVTSRAVLSLRAEHDYPVLPLPLPDPVTHLPQTNWGSTQQCACLRIALLQCGRTLRLMPRMPRLWLKSAIAWNYDLLEVDEQCLFRALSVFVGGWTIPVAAVVCSSTEYDMLDGMNSLVKQSMVQVIDGTSSSSAPVAEPQMDAEPRFRMLETIREYALEQAVTCGELDELRRQHVAYVRQLADAAFPVWSEPPQGQH